MNKLLLSSICAAALTSAASAFTLDLSSLNGQTLGLGSISTAYGNFTIVGPATISGGVANVAAGDTMTVIYPSNVTYVGAFTGANTSLSTGSVQYTGTAGGNDVASITFDAVPEPSSTALLGLGGLALILRRRK